MQKKRPFTRRQRSNLLKQRLREERAAAKAARFERKDYGQSLSIFKGCDPERTERLADG
jgi:hypothetical protein